MMRLLDHLWEWKGTWCLALLLLGAALTLSGCNAHYPNEKIVWKGYLLEVRP